ncbi:MAG: magnesium transporter [Lentisphaeria bacterium]|nr:magnesium transporter [Lentisphaeria bacterium]
MSQDTIFKISKNAFADLDLQEQLDVFGSLDTKLQIDLIDEFHKLGNIAELQNFLNELDVHILQAILAKMELQVCREIVEVLKGKRRVKLLKIMVLEPNRNDLQAAVNTVELKDLFKFLQIVDVPTRHDVFRLLTPEHKVSLLLFLDDQEEDELHFQSFLSELNAADIADVLEDIDKDELKKMFLGLSNDLAAKALVELQNNTAELLFDRLSDDQVALYFPYIANDDVNDLLELVDDERRASLISLMSKELREDVEALQEYEADSAGDVMTTETFALPWHCTASAALKQLHTLDTNDPVFHVYVVESNQTLIGVVSLAGLIRANHAARLIDICEKDPIYATADEDQEDIANKFRKYNLWVVPVVDEELKLVGRITVDDILDVVQEENDEDIAKLIGVSDIDDEQESPFLISRKRLPWLLITMFAGLVNSIIIGKMMDITNVAVIAIFVPAILAMGGNTGIQASTICVRRLATGDTRQGKILTVIAREISVGALMGLVCGLASAAMVIIFLMQFPVDTEGITTAKLAFIVGASMVNSMTFSSAFGAITPMILHQYEVDPAVASGPFVTTSNDISSSLIYFATCYSLINYF